LTGPKGLSLKQSHFWLFQAGTMDGLNEITRRLESQKAAVEQALEALREVGGEMSGGSVPSTSDGGNKQSAPQKATWAASQPGCSRLSVFELKTNG
jgi:hypothetical protein